MRISVLTSCSKRKAFAPEVALTARNLAVAALEDLCAEWSRRRLASDKTVPAAELYQGRAALEAKRAATEGAGDLFFISAGHGLVPSSQPVPSYSLTVAPGTEDSIQSRLRSKKEWNPALWWARLHRESATPIADIIRNRKDQLFVLALPAPYLTLICEDLTSLDDASIRRVRIVSAGDANLLPPRVANAVLPYDERLDGPDSPLPGTKSDFAQRASAHFVSLARASAGSPHERHCQMVSDALSALRKPEVPRRQRRTDNEIVSAILTLWKAEQGQSSRILRALRRNEGLACEQGRFRALYRRAADMQASK